VKIYENLIRETHSFYGLDPSVTRGITVGAADFDDDGRLDLLVGNGAGIRALVRVLSGRDLQELTTIYPYGAFTGATYVAGP
jgi:hypothetical protein